MDAALMTTESGRAVLLGLINMFLLCRILPPLWCLIPILPNAKPGKQPDRIESHRPVSLMAALLKLIRFYSTECGSQSDGQCTAGKAAARWEQTKCAGFS